MKKEFETEKCSLLPLGSSRNGRDLHISVNMTEKLDKVLLYRHGTAQEIGYALVTEDENFGNVYALKIKNAGNCDYALMSGERFVRHEYAKVVNHYKLQDGEVLETYSVYEDDFDWEEDVRIFHPFEESVIYRLHVRGFTKHRSSKVENKGCFAGIVEKIPYLKELGITAIELMPAYEFDDVILQGRAKGATNYWGYGSACYFAPKASFSRRGKGSQVNEFKQMVKELHKNDIEVIMEFHFEEGMSPHTILDALRFWVLDYHIDGIHANFNVAPLNMIQSDPLISMVKLIGNYENGESGEGYHLFRGEKRFAFLNEAFLGCERRFIKSDDGQVISMMEQVRKNPATHALINYIAAHNTMSLMDAVSYDCKHNEENNEGNTDGTDYNFSWNCGMEGPTRKKKILRNRFRQMKNSMALLMLSQGTPMLYAGDEMGKSCGGNNNPYCQDNEISWLNWSDLSKNHSFYIFVKEMIAFRREHRVLHMREEPRQMDILGAGCPDLSYHGLEPWRVDTSYNSRQFAFLYGGAYGKEGESDLYVACNMNWDDRIFAVPYVDKKKHWVQIISTNEDECGKRMERVIKVAPRSVLVLESRPEEMEKCEKNTKDSEVDGKIEDTTKESVD